MKRFVTAKPVSTQVVVDGFLGLHDYWFTMPRNSLFGRHADCRKALIHFVETGEEPDDIDVEYVVDKFQREWLGQFFREVAGER